MGGRLLAAEVRSRVFRLVAGRLHLARELVLIRGQAGLGEHVDIERLGFRVLRRLVHPTLEVLQRLGERADDIVMIHGILLFVSAVSARLLWRFPPSKAVGRWLGSYPRGSRRSRHRSYPWRKGLVIPLVAVRRIGVRSSTASDL